MTAPAEPTIQLGPEWVVTEMPPGFQNRVEEIRRLVSDLEAMGRFGRLLWEVGPRLVEPVREMFAALKFEAETIPGSVVSGVAVRVDGRRRLLLHISAEDSPLQRKSGELAHVFKMLHEVADEQDHVVLVTNNDSARRPSEREEALTPDAAAFLARLSVGHVTAATLFGLWKLGLQEPERARAQVERLYALESGTWQLPAAVLV